MPKQYFHICNPDTPKLTGGKNLYSKKDLEEVKEEENAVYLLNIHLNWDGRALSSDYGFEIATEIRTLKRSLAPIIFYSPVQKGYFEHKSKTSLRYKLLFGRGSAFVEAPFTDTKLADVIANVPKLTGSSLHDVVTMLADVKGIVLDKLTHDLTFGFDPMPSFNEVGPYLTDLQKALVDFDSNREKLVRLNNEGDESAFYNTKETFLSICNVNLTEAGTDIANVPRPKHKILILEDIETELNKVADYLGKHFSVIAMRNGEDAVEHLRSDTSNEILAVISDWRLYTDDSHSYWQKYQGYEVLEVASKTGFRGLFALTSLADFVVHHIRNRTGFKFFLVKKHNLRTPEQWFLFSDLIYTSCIDAISVISEMPSSKNWSKDVNGFSYKELYIQMKSDLDSTKFFASIWERADEIWDYLVMKSHNNYKDVGLLKEIYGLEIPRKKLDLSIILILRLIWLGLWYSLDDKTDGKDREEVAKLLERVYKIVCTGNYGYDFLGNDNVEMNKLCLTIKDIQQRKILPHEQFWLLQKNLIG